MPATKEQIRQIIADNNLNVNGRCLAFLRHFREVFTHPYEISLHQGFYTQLAANFTFPC